MALKYLLTVACVLMIFIEQDEAGVVFSFKTEVVPSYPPLQPLPDAPNQEIYMAVIGGNSQGEPCQFPFKYQGNTYDSCTSKDVSSGLWCATTSDYDRDKKWGYCPNKDMGVIGGNSHGEPCQLPFKYQGNTYDSCTSKDVSSGLWCATTSDYDRDKKWGYCPNKAGYVPSLPPLQPLPDALNKEIYMAVIGGNSHGEPCQFPFKFHGKMYDSCTSKASSKGLWCATTSDYDRDKKWGYCPNKEAVIGGNSAGEPCQFPFKFHGKMYDFCTSKASSKGLWCATTSDYDRDKKWGYCPNQEAVIGGNTAGEPCQFPFKFHGKMYDSCTSKASSKGLWCATTSDYDRDKKWGYCPNQEAVIGGNSAGEPCQFPFKFHGKMYDSCTSKASSKGLWCATTSDYDRDKKWGYCPNQGNGK